MGSGLGRRWFGRAIAGWDNDGRLIPNAEQKSGTLGVSGPQGRYPPHKTLRGLGFRSRQEQTGGGALPEVPAAAPGGLLCALNTPGPSTSSHGFP